MGRSFAELAVMRYGQYVERLRTSRIGHLGVAPTLSPGQAWTREGAPPSQNSLVYGTTPVPKMSSACQTTHGL